jgi:F-type H+-transporting ATPase subunit a
MSGLSMPFYSLINAIEHGEVVADTASNAVEHGAETHGLADTIAHAAGHVAEKHAPEFPNIVEILHHGTHGQSPIVNLLFEYRMVVFSTVVWLFLGILAFLAYRKRSLIPNGLQNFVEWVVEGLTGLVTGILGPGGVKYVPFIGTLFVYIFCMNLLGLIPGMASPTSKLNTTLALAICVFLYVQYSGIRNLGLLGYIHHLAGSPHSVVEWCLVPLNLPLHIIGELARPVSLSLRLFGNISGEEMLLAIFATLGVTILGFTHLPVGIPLQLPFIFLALLTSFVQALVFTLLTTIYFSLMSTHDEEHH